MTIDEEVAAISARKKPLVFKAGPGPGDKVKATLTPVGTEKPRPIPDLPGAYMAQEAVEAQVRQIRAAAAALELTADALELAIGKTPEQRADEDAALERKLQEQAADRRAADKASGRQPTRTEAKQAEAAAKFTADYIEMQKQAQASAFEPKAVPVGSGSAAPGWVCPVHGDSTINQLTSKAGREYRACTTCGQYEKGR